MDLHPRNDNNNVVKVVHFVQLNHRITTWKTILGVCRLRSGSRILLLVIACSARTYSNINKSLTTQPFGIPSLCRAAVKLRLQRTDAGCEHVIGRVWCQQISDMWKQSFTVNTGEAASCISVLLQPGCRLLNSRPVFRPLTAQCCLRRLWFSDAVVWTPRRKRQQRLN